MTDEESLQIIFPTKYGSRVCGVLKVHLSRIMQCTTPVVLSFDAADIVWGNMFPITANNEANKHTVCTVLYHIIYI